MSWKIYQDIGDGLDARRLLGLDRATPTSATTATTRCSTSTSTRTPPPGSPLARSGPHRHQRRKPADALRHPRSRRRRPATLPQVSWIVAPEAFTEHPNWPANYGAWYVSQVLDALTAEPGVWGKTALFLHLRRERRLLRPRSRRTRPSAGSRAVDGVARQRAVPRRPGHLGGSPGTRGPTDSGCGCRCRSSRRGAPAAGSARRAFDHTSIIRLLEQRFGVPEPNITPWRRRAVCGDLTSAFCTSPRTRLSDAVPTLPSVGAFAPSEQQIDDKVVPPSSHPVPPATGAVPEPQEPGVKPSRRLGYRLDVATLRPAPAAFQVAMRNRGELGAGLQARSLSIVGGPWAYTVGAGDSLIAELPHLGAYDLSVHGPQRLLPPHRGLASDHARASRPRVAPRTARSPFTSAPATRVADEGAARPSWSPSTYGGQPHGSSWGRRARDQRRHLSRRWLV